MTHLASAQFETTAFQPASGDDQIIRRRPDGSIDTAYYMAEGRAARAKEARLIAGKSGRKLGVPGFWKSLGNRLTVPVGVRA